MEHCQEITGYKVRVRTMSKLIVEVVEVKEVKPHPHADRLEIVVVKGWQVVVGKGDFHTGDKATYFPPDVVLPQDTSDRMGVTQYLSNGRIKAVRLRGEPSFGFLYKSNEALKDTPIGANVSSIFGATKYVPPKKFSAGDAAPDIPEFQRYTSIEHLSNFPDVFELDEPVSVTEKLHGTNCRVGRIQGEMCAGSHKVIRKRPKGDLADNVYWYPWSLKAVRELFTLLPESRDCILYGEVYGKVQELTYGLSNAIGFRAFDLMIGGHYLDPDDFHQWCMKAGVEFTPILDVIPYKLDEIKGLASGRSTVVGADNIREGVVVKPVVERTHPKIGRVILKCIGAEYMLSKGYNKTSDE